jgi:hypothetical protein
MASPLLQSCANHSDRRGFAICMSCRKVVCQECATAWDGVNYCRSCLAARDHVRRRATLREWMAWAVFCGVLFFAAVRALAWSTAMIARIW